MYSYAALSFHTLLHSLQPIIDDMGVVVQIEVAKLYQEAKVNPLAGCLPTLITLPVWIGLYRALSNVADEGLLSEGFFWIPSLAGPTTLAAQKAVSSSSCYDCYCSHLPRKGAEPGPQGEFLVLALGYLKVSAT